MDDADLVVTVAADVVRRYGEEALPHLYDLAEIAAGLNDAARLRRGWTLPMPPNACCAPERSAMQAVQAQHYRDHAARLREQACAERDVIKRRELIRLAGELEGSTETRQRPVLV
jgi:hypothetical protein